MANENKKEINYWQIAALILLGLIIVLLIIDFIDRQTPKVDPLKENVGGIWIDEQSFASLVNAMGGYENLTTFQLCDVEAHKCVMLQRKK